VARALRRSHLDDDDDDDLTLYDPRWLARGKKVVRDGGRVVTPLFLTDSRRQPVFDVVVNKPGYLIDRLAQRRAGVGEAAVRQRARVADAYEDMCVRLGDAWSFDKALAPRASGADARAAWIKRTGDAWRRTWRDQGDDGDEADVEGDYTASPGGASAYAQGVWSAQNAIRPGSPDAAAQVEAMQRRMSMSQPTATAARVAAERRRYRPRDAVAIADRETAYAEYCHRIENSWRRWPL
jgi:hypothetical protein